MNNPPATMHLKAPSGTGSIFLCGGSAGDSDYFTHVHKNVNCPNCKSLMINSHAVQQDYSYKDIGGIPIKAIIEAKLTPEQLEGYYLGCVLDYLARANYKNMGKDKLQDYCKAMDYLRWLIAAERDREEPE